MVCKKRTQPRILLLQFPYLILEKKPLLLKPHPFEHAALPEDKAVHREKDRGQEDETRFAIF